MARRALRVTESVRVPGVWSECSFLADGLDPIRSRRRFHIWCWKGDQLRSWTGLDTSGRVQVRCGFASCRACDQIVPPTLLEVYRPSTPNPFLHERCLLLLRAGHFAFQGLSMRLRYNKPHRRLSAEESFHLEPPSFSTNKLGIR